MKARLKNWIWVVTLAVLAGGMVSGCEPKAEPEQNPYPQDFLRKDWPQSKGQAPKLVRRAYKIRENDKIEIIYNVQTAKAEQRYQLKIRDVIDVRFPYQPNLSQTGLEIQSDGTVQMALIGTIFLFDKTVDQVQKELTEKYSQFIKKPVLNVTFKESKRDIADLREAITTAPRGQSRLVPVAPDGAVALPLIGSVLAAGKTVDEVHEEVNKKYHELGLEELEVTVNLEYISPLQVYVMGEVNKPGLVFSTLGAAQNVTEMSLLQAIAQAGSYNPKRAELSKVLLIRRRGVAYPQAAVINVEQLLVNATKVVDKRVQPNQAIFRRDIWLEDGDLIYVPTTELAKRADYIEYVWTRGIYAVVPMSYAISASYSAIDNVDWLGPSGSGL